VGQTGETERIAIEQSARDLGVADRVRLLGGIPLDRLLPLYREYDLFVLPTGPGEGIPRVLLEAMAAGLPVVTTRVAGIPSLISSEHNGILTEGSGAEAVVEAVVEAIERLLADAPLRQRLIRGGYHTASTYTLEHQSAEMVRVLAARTGLTFRAPAARTRTTTVA
jgi:glycosyltransferase involved in cell wall biosynthesis